MSQRVKYIKFADVCGITLSIPNLDTLPRVYIYADTEQKSNLPQICQVHICCKYEIRKALQAVQR